MSSLDYLDASKNASTDGEVDLQSLVVGVGGYSEAYISYR
jgi:hypothetical protein